MFADLCYEKGHSQQKNVIVLVNNTRYSKAASYDVQAPRIYLRMGCPMAPYVAQPVGKYVSSAFLQFFFKIRINPLSYLGVNTISEQNRT